MKEDVLSVLSVLGSCCVTRSIHVGTDMLSSLNYWLRF